MKTKIKELSLPFEEHEVDIKNHVWITAQKKKMPVNQMVTKHIKNCINCWNSNGNMSIPKDYSVMNYQKEINEFRKNN